MPRITAILASLAIAAAPPPPPVAPSSPCYGATDDLGCEVRRKALARANHERAALRREAAVGATPLEIPAHLFAGATRRADPVLALEAAEAAPKYPYLLSTRQYTFVKGEGAETHQSSWLLNFSSNMPSKFSLSENTFFSI